MDALYDNMITIDRDYDNEGYQELSNRLHAQYSLIPRVQEDTFPLYFSEIMGGDKVKGQNCQAYRQWNYHNECIFFLAGSVLLRDMVQDAGRRRFLCCTRGWL